MARPRVRRWSAWLSPFLNSSALLDTELPGPQVVTLPLRAGVRPEPLWDGPPDGGRGLEVRAIGAASEVDV